MKYQSQFEGIKVSLNVIYFHMINFVNGFL